MGGRPRGRFPSPPGAPAPAEGLELTARAVTAGSSSVRIVHCSPEQDPVLDFPRSVVPGDAGPPPWLPFRFLYDAEGSKPFKRTSNPPHPHPPPTPPTLP